MVTENCKKIEPVVVKLYSKTNIPLFSWTRCREHTPGLLRLCTDHDDHMTTRNCKSWLRVWHFVDQHVTQFISFYKCCSWRSVQPAEHVIFSTAEWLQAAFRSCYGAHVDYIGIGAVRIFAAVMHSIFTWNNDDLLLVVIAVTLWNTP